MDNLTVTESGLVFIQEDPGNNPRLAKIWMYDPNADVEEVGGTSGFTLIAQHDPARFTNPSGPSATPAPGSTTGFGQDDESSGIIDVTHLIGGRHFSFLLDVQAHYSIGGELVEGGQLLRMDVALANPGDNKVALRAGNDRYDGGFGDDRIDGGTGHDSLFGNYGVDKIIGAQGNDILSGGPDRDLLQGGNGNDTGDGGTGNDLLRGDRGNDTLAGGVGDDRIEGGEGNDNLSGGFGRDFLKGDEGNDVLQGNQDGDRLHGGSGNDRLVGGGDADFLVGSTGNDTFVFERPDEGSDTILDFGLGRDHIVLEFGVAAGDVRFIGFAGPDDTPGAGPTLTYSSATGNLLWDPTGGDASDQVQLATLLNSPELDRADILFV